MAFTSSELTASQSETRDECTGCWGDLTSWERDPCDQVSPLTPSGDLHETHCTWPDLTMQASEKILHINDGDFPLSLEWKPSEQPAAIGDDEIPDYRSHRSGSKEKPKSRLTQQNTSLSMASVGTEASIMGGVMTRILSNRSLTSSAIPSVASPSKSPDISAASTERAVSVTFIVVIVVTLPTIVSCSTMLVWLEPLLDTCASDSREAIRHFRVVGVSICLTMTAINVAVGLALGRAVTWRISTLTRFMECLGEANATELSRDFGSHFSKLLVVCQIRDVRHMEVAFCRLSRAVETFERYLPETIVRSIFRGEERVSRLHVSRRVVSIMFSDIADFTTIAENLAYNDLLFILTRYFSVMSRIIASYGGVVAEILGDGLLVYFNTPDDVINHASKACSAALAQCQVLPKLNDEFGGLGLPQVALRIGIHTGRVLTGNIGSESKMKFGCIGDPVNLASRLEGLCKVYGCTIICSGATCDSLPPSEGFCSRELDYVQVKGKQTPVRIYEIVGIKDDMSALRQAYTITSEALHSSTQAMQAVNILAWNPLRSLRRFSGSKDTSSDSEGASSRSSASQAKTALTRPEPERLVTAGMLEYIRKYEIALKLFQEARFGEARDRAKQLLSERPEDRSVILLLDRCCRYIGPDNQIVGLSKDELNTWSGVFRMHDK